MSTSVRERIQAMQASIAELSRELPEGALTLYLNSARHTLDLAVVEAQKQEEQEKPVSPEELQHFFELGAQACAEQKSSVAMLCVAVQQAVSKMSTGDPRAVQIFEAYRRGYAVARRVKLTG